MNPLHEIDALGFYPHLIRRALTRALGGVNPISCLFQVEPAFDMDAMFSHLNALALTPNSLIQLHADEQDGGVVSIATAIHPIHTIRGISFMEVVDQANVDEPSTQEVTIALNLGAVRRSDGEPNVCDDPTCEADHGFQLVSIPDDISMRICAAVDGVEALEKAQYFIDTISSLMADHHA